MLIVEIRLILVLFCGCFFIVNDNLIQNFVRLGCGKVCVNGYFLVGYALNKCKVGWLYGFYLEQKLLVCYQEMEVGKVQKIGGKCIEVELGKQENVLDWICVRFLEDKIVLGIVDLIGLCD